MNELQLSLLQAEGEALRRQVALLEQTLRAVVGRRVGCICNECCAEFRAKADSLLPVETLDELAALRELVASLQGDPADDADHRTALLGRLEREQSVSRLYKGVTESLEKLVDDNMVLAAWCEGNLTEGQAAKLIGADRVSLRAWKAEVLWQVRDRLSLTRPSGGGATPAPALSSNETPALGA